MLSDVQHVPAAHARNRSRGGFTLVELLVAAVAASVLAVTSGLMVFYIYRSWSRTTESLEVDRDASFALAMFRNVIHAAGTTNIVSSAGRLDIDQAAFYTSGSNLLYDADTTAAGDIVIVVNGRLHSFSNSVTPGRSVYVALRLNNGEEMVGYNSMIANRH